MYGETTTTNSQYMRDPAAAIRLRKYALAQQLQKAGTDMSPTVGTGNTSMQAIARVLQGGMGAFLSNQVEGEAQEASAAERAERARREALIMGLSTGQTPGAAPADAPMPDRLGGAPPATPEERANGGVLAGPTAPVAPVQQQPLAPQELMPHFEAASRETGIPVDVLVAQAKQESDFNPNARGRSGEIGVMQVMPSTARQPGFGVAGVDPATLSDPAANIMFGARYSAARSPGTDWSNPEARAAALGRYNGGGDPNYAANVSRHLPAGAPAPQPPPPGGVAARTGGVDVAGPPSAPPAPAAPSGQRTPEQLRQAAAQVAALGGTAAQAQALYAQADALERRAFQGEDRTARAAERAADDATRERYRREDIARQDAARAEARAEAERTRNGGSLPTGYERGPDGAARRIAGLPATADTATASTEAERKAGSYLERMQGAEDLLQNLTRARPDGTPGYDAGNIRDRAAQYVPGFLGGNWMVSDQGQRYMNAASEWARAKLRLESGAVISDSEAREEARTYFPMPGDSPDTIAQKQALRDTATSAIRRQAGRSAPDAPAAQPDATAPGTPSATAPRVIEYDAQGRRVSR